MKISLTLAAIGFVFCASCSDGGGSSSASTLGTGVNGAPVHVSSIIPMTANPEQAGLPLLTLAVKFVEYNDPSTGKAVLSQADAQTVVDGINYIYGQCQMQVKLDQYVALNPADKGFTYGLTSMANLDPIRKAFDDASELVVINTGPWDHNALGAANAWTAMPGQDPSGAVIEGTVASDAPIIAHELGHYLGLDHVADPADMMNPLIYSTSTRVDAGQCDIMRQTAQSVRVHALR